MKKNYLKSVTARALLLMLSLLCLPVLAMATDWKDNVATAITNAGSGDGSEEGKAIEIASAEELAYLAQQVNAGGNLSLTSGGTLTYADGFKDKYFKLTADIDLGGEEWTPIGNDYNKDFKGNFDGDNHTVTGLKITNNNYEYVGLFGFTNGATIKNLGVHIHQDGISVTYRSGGGYIGGIVGYTSGSDQISNCYTTGGSIKIVATGTACKAGGIVGTFNDEGANLSDCYSTCDISAEGNNVLTVAGGIIGYAPGTISNAYATGKIKASTTGSQYACAGGIIGAGAWMTATNLLALNVGGITATGGSVNGAGRICGSLSGTMTNCYASSKIAGAWSEGATGKDGAITYGSTYQALMTWNDSYWTVSNNNLPVLKNMTNAPQLSTSTYLAEKEPDPTPTPPPYIPTYYNVTLHPAEGAICKPRANTYVVEEWYNFSFTLALEEGYQNNSAPVVKANGVVIEPRVSDGKYILRSVTEDTDLVIEGVMKDIPTSNAEVDGVVKVQTIGSALHIYLPQEETVEVYTASGLLYKGEKLSAGNTEIQLSTGFYFIKIAGKTYKAVVR